LKEGDHPGKEFTLQLVDRFAVSSPNGCHVCLVFPLMGQTMEDFSRRFDGRIPATFLKQFVKQALLALDHTHGMGIIHTGVTNKFAKKSTHVNGQISRRIT
jgi:serine/threonine-protein kinase SRPK3